MKVSRTVKPSGVALSHANPNGLRVFQPGELPSKRERLMGRRIRSDKHEDAGILYSGIRRLGTAVNARKPLLVKEADTGRNPAEVLYRPTGK